MARPLSIQEEDISVQVSCVGHEDIKSTRPLDEADNVVLCSGTNRT